MSYFYPLFFFHLCEAKRDLVLRVVDLLARRTQRARRPVLDVNVDDVVPVVGRDLDVLADALSKLLQRVGPVDDLLDGEAPLAEALRHEVVVRLKAEAPGDADLAGLLGVLDAIQELSRDVAVHDLVEHELREVADDLVLEDLVAALLPGGGERDLVVLVQKDRHLGFWLWLVLLQEYLSFWLGLLQFFYYC